MNKVELVGALAQRTGMTKVDATVVTGELFQIIADALTAGEKVRIDDFGTFEVKNRAPRVGRNPKANVPVNIPARKAPNFTAHKTLKDAVANSLIKNQS